MKGTSFKEMKFFFSVIGIPLAGDSPAKKKRYFYPSERPSSMVTYAARIYCILHSDIRIKGQKGDRARNHQKRNQLKIVYIPPLLTVS